MIGVRYSDPNNSTHFTTCCSVAILPHQQRCPGCRKDVFPFYEGMSDKDRAEAASGYCHHNTQRARDRRCRSYS